jgi:hypothetical protein
VRALLYLRLDFEDDTSVRFGAAADGHSLRVDQEPLREYDMEESGSTAVRGFDGIRIREALERVEPMVDDDGYTFGVLMSPAPADCSSSTGETSCTRRTTCRQWCAKRRSADCRREARALAGV